MVSLGNEEQAAVEGLAACLAIALRRSDRYSLSDVNQTKVQKLVYLGAKEYDIDLTYSWYLAGSYAVGAEEGVSSINTAFDTLPQPPSPDITDRQDEPVESHLDSIVDETADVDREFEIERAFDPSLSDKAPPSVDSSTDEDVDWDSWFDDASAEVLPEEFELPVSDVVNFYERILGQYPLHPTDRFLQQFYEYHAPAEYTTIYEHCLRLRNILSNLGADIESALDGQSQEVDLQRHREKFGRELSEFHMELYATESVRETADAVVEGSEPIEEAIIKLASLSVDDLTEAHLEAVESLQSYFYYTVWKYPALKISITTATGPDAEEIRSEHLEEYQTFDQTVETRRTQMIEELEEAGLRPSAADYPDRGPDSAEQFGEMISLYQDHPG